MFYLVLFAMVAAFLALRLYSVLGRRTGHEQPAPKPAEERVASAPLSRPVDVKAEVRDVAQRSVESRAEAGLRAIVAADPSFDVAQFLDGAKSAYRMILEAFWTADRDTLSWLTEDDVRNAFEEAIQQREADGHVLNNRLVAIERAVISDAALEGRLARVTVRFDADIVAITRDRDGTVVAGSLSDAVPTNDIWTFTRTLKSDDPNWKLAETDEA